VYVCHPEHVAEINVPKIAISDHYPVCLTRKINQKDYPSLKYKTIKYRCFKKFDKNNFWYINFSYMFRMAYIHMVNYGTCR
jgi:hypothetical protein